MNPRMRGRIVDVIVVGLIAYAVYPMFTRQAPEVAVDDFATAVDLAPLQRIAVHDVGRLKSFDSFARATMQQISGPHPIPGQAPTFSYLDMLFNSPTYLDRDVIYVKKPIRRPMAVVMRQLNLPEEQVTTFMKQGMLSERMIRQPAMIEELKRLDQDVIRTAKFVQRIESALFLLDPHSLSDRFRVVPPPSGDPKAAWVAGEAIWGQDALGDGHRHQPPAASIPGLADELAAQLRADWQNLAGAWRQDPAAASAAVASLATHLASVAPSLYPAPDKLGLESWYFRMKAFVWDWIIYIMAAVPLLLFIIYRWRTAYWLGFAVLLVAFGIHTSSLGIRWYLAGRIPNANMFEAILAATWLGVVGAFILELVARKTAMRGLFFLASAVCAMVAMMCQHFLPVALQSDITNTMPILDSVWLYIHTNVIIWSYVLIGMAAVTALLYLRYRFGGGDPAVAKTGGAGSLILQGAPGKGDSFLKEERATWGQVLDASTMVLMELAFVMLWAGLVMGAIWADCSWGRPWGWDPKEVFALCTFVIFLILVHVRFKVRDKGLWTAVLAVVGCGVMLFNWIVINFYISGLHSYA